MTRIWQAWEGYWFRPAPLFDLAVVRVIAVAFQLHHLATIRPRTDFGPLAALPDFMWAPVATMRLLMLPFGWDARPSEDFVVGIYWLTLAIGFVALVGYRTTASLVLFAGGSLFLQAFEYSFREVHHPEAIVIVALVLLALSPSGAVLSLDDRRARRRRAPSTEIAEGPLERESAFARWPLLVIQWMFGLIYLSAAFHKLAASGLDWMNGWTLQYYMIQDSMRWGTEASGVGAGMAAEPGLGVWLGQHHEVAILASWMSILFETTFWLILIFPRLAFVLLPIGIGFHVTVYIIQRAPFLSFVWLYAVFVPWRDIVRRAATWFAKTDGPPLILFDGECGLCNSWVEFVLRRDVHARFRFTPLQSDLGKALLRQEGVSNASLDSIRLFENGVLYQRSTAVLRILWRLPAPWPATILFLAVPAVVRDFCYDVIARHRYAWFGRTDTCRLPTPAERARFIVRVD